MLPARGGGSAVAGGVSVVDGFLVVTLVPLKTTFVAPPPIPACTISLPTTAGEQDVCSSATTRWPQPIRADRVRRTRIAGRNFETAGPRFRSEKNHLSAKTSSLYLARPVPVFTQGRSLSRALRPSLYFPGDERGIARRRSENAAAAAAIAIWQDFNQR